MYMMMLRNPRRVGLVLSLSALVAVSTAAWAATELAKINATTISLEEFNKKYGDNAKYFQYRAPSKKAVLDDLIKRELGIQEAKKLGLDKDPEVVDRMNTVLFQALIDKKLSPEFDKIKISDRDAKDFYAKHPEIRTSQIFIAVPGNATPAQEKEAQDKIKKIQSEHLAPGKMSFAEVAQRYSEGNAAPMGGDIDYQTPDKLDPAYYEAAVALRTPGKVSGIVRTAFGYHIIKLTGIRGWEDADRDQVKRALFDSKRTELFDKYMNSLRSSAKVTVNGDLIK